MLITNIKHKANFISPCMRHVPSALVSVLCGFIVPWWENK